MSVREDERPRVTPGDEPGRGSERASLLSAHGAEFVGTFVLVLAITTTAVAAKLDTPVAGATFGSLSVALVNGLVLMVLVAALGHLSGAHLNPAVTVGLASVGRFPWARVPGYVVAQIAGGVVAALATWLVAGPAARSTASLAATTVSPGVNDLRAFVAEVLVTFLLVLVVTAVTTDDRAPAALAPVVIGGALAVAIFIAGPLDGAAVNPARALGPMIVAGSFSAWWVVVVGPLAGGVLGALTYDALLRRGAPPRSARPEHDAS